MQAGRNSGSSPLDSDRFFSESQFDDVQRICDRIPKSGNFVV